MRPRIEDAYMMNSKDRIDVNMEMIERGAFSATSSEIGDYGSVTDFERWFIDVQDHKMTWEEYENRVKQLEEVNTDWFKELFRNSVTHRHSLSISGGNEKTTFYLSGSYMDNQATAKNVSEKTYTGTVKVNTYLRENLRVGGSLDFSARDSKSFFAVDSFSPKNLELKNSPIKTDATRAIGSPANTVATDIIAPPWFCNMGANTTSAKKP